MIIGYILTLLGVIEVGLGLYFLFRYQKSPATISYGMFALGSAVYVGANGIGYLTGSFFIGERLGWVGGILATIFFLPFSLSFPFPRKSWQELLPWIAWPTAIFVLGLLFTDLFIEQSGTVKFGEGYKTATGEYFWLMTLFIAIYWIWSIANLVRSHHISGGFQRRILQYVLVGTIISLSGAIIFDVIYPLVETSKLGFLGSIFNVAWLGMTAYILVKQ